MAIRVRKNRKRQFLVYWRNPHTGRQESAAYETLLDARRMDAEIKYRLEFAPETFKKEAASRQEAAAAHEKEVVCLEDVFIMFLKEKQYSKSRVRVYVNAMKLPLQHLGRKRLDAITEQDLARVVTATMGKDIRKTTAVIYCRLVFAVLRWAKKRHLLAELPEMPELPTAHYRHFVPPTPEELSRLYAAAVPHIRRVIILGAKIGMRVGPCEMFKLKWSDVDLDRAVVRVPAAKKNTAEPWREVPIQPALLPLFRDWQQEDEATGMDYVVHFKGHPIRTITTAWEKTLKAAGIERHIRPYDLRHAFATDLIAGGADPGTVARLMGHTSVNMIFAHYQHVLTKQKVQAIEALPEINLYDRPLYVQKETLVMQ